ncbi:MAG: AAA family ATPase [Sulfuricaulis sp.]
MSSNPPQFSKPFDKHFGSARITGDPFLWALVNVLAAREKMSLSSWVSAALRVALDALVPQSVKNARSAGQPPVWETAAAEAWETPASWGRFTSRQLMCMLNAVRPEVEALIAERGAKLSPLDALRVPKKRRHRLFDPKALAPISDQDNDKKVWPKRLRRSGHEREILRVTDATIRHVGRLLQTAPHLCEATRFALGALALARRAGNRLSLPPLLLVGPPAAGKTWWAEELARALGVTSELIPMGSVTSSFELAGGSSSWNAARPGRILRAFIGTTRASPVFVLDEVEKISPGNYDPAPVLLHLTETLSAARFRDEFFDTEFDVSRAIFIATANDPSRMDMALRSRFREIEVKAPTREQRLPIIASLWGGIRRDLPQLPLPGKLNDHVMETLVDSFRDARQVRRLIEEGLGRAALRRGPLELVASDVGGPAIRAVCTATSSVSKMRPQP